MDWVLSVDYDLYDAYESLKKYASKKEIPASHFEDIISEIDLLDGSSIYEGIFIQIYKIRVVYK